MRAARAVVHHGSTRRAARQLTAARSLRPTDGRRRPASTAPKCPQPSLPPRRGATPPPVSSSLPALDALLDALPPIVAKDGREKRRLSLGPPELPPPPPAVQKLPRVLRAEAKERPAPLNALLDSLPSIVDNDDDDDEKHRHRPTSPPDTPPPPTEKRGRAAARKRRRRRGRSRDARRDGPGGDGKQDKDLIRAARTLRAIVLRLDGERRRRAETADVVTDGGTVAAAATNRDEDAATNGGEDEERVASQGEAMDALREENPDAAAVLKSRGGVKQVSQQFPYLYKWEVRPDLILDDGRGTGGAHSTSSHHVLTVPIGDEARRLREEARATRVLFLDDAFREAGGVVAEIGALGDDRRRRSGGGESGVVFPSVVAVDAEGTHMNPPLLVQVCPIGSDRVYLDQPREQKGNRKRGGGGGGSPAVLSNALRALLADPAVTKVFCGAGDDLRSLGLATPVRNTLCLQSGSFLLDEPSRRMRDAYRTVGAVPSLTDLATEHVGDAPFGGEEGFKGRSRRIVYQKNRALQKQFGRVTKRPSGGIGKELRWYGAADAWMTAKVFEGMTKHRELRNVAAGAEKKDNGKDVVEIEGMAGKGSDVEESRLVKLWNQAVTAIWK